MGIIRQYVQQTAAIADELGIVDEWHPYAWIGQARSLVVGKHHPIKDVNVPLPTGNAVFRRRVLDTPLITLTLYPSEAEMMRFYDNPSPVLFSIDGHVKRRLTRTFTPKNGKPITYGIRFDDCAYPLKAVVELPGVKKPKNQADGFAFETPGWLRWRLLKDRYEQCSRVLEDAVSSFGFQDVSQISGEGGRVSHVCIVPRQIQLGEFSEMLERALSEPGQIFGVNYLESGYNEPSIGYDFDMRREGDSIVAKALICGRDTSVSPQQAAERTLKAFGSRPAADAQVVLGRYETRITWDSMPAWLRRSYTACGDWFGDHITGPIDHYTLGRKRRKRFARDTRERITTTKLGELQMRTNFDDPKSCFIAMSPDMQDEIDTEVQRALAEAQE